MISVQLLGGVCLRSGGAAMTGPPVQRHRIALLALIVSSWPHPISRDRAMALLWPERDTAGGRRLLNLAVHVLRAALGERTIASAGDGLLFQPAELACDLHDLRSAIAARDHQAVVRVYAGPLLDGFHLAESPEFGFWLDGQRADLEHAYIGALLALVERQRAAGDIHGWVGNCRRLVAADPHSAAHALALMEALDASGDRAGALRHAEEYTRRLRLELELDPDPAIAALADRLRSGPGGSNGRASAVPPPAASVAVLPFRSLASDPETEYFADGITEDVIAQLSRIRALKVISRASVMPFKARTEPLGRIAQRLGVGSVLDGSVRRAGDRVRVVASLIDVASDTPLWTETYDRELTDIFAIQSDLALQIAAALRAELTGDERTRLRRSPTGDIRAYYLLLRGRRALGRYTAEGGRRAVEYFERAIARDESFAPAHALMAMAYTEMGEQGWLAPELAYARATEAVHRALALDPELSEAHCTLAHLKTVRDFDWVGAEEEFRRALELSPGNAEAYDLYGRLCAALARHDEAIALCRRARELDPLSHPLDVVSALLRAGRHDEAVAGAENALELDTGHERTRATLGWAYILSGRAAEGIAQLERAVEVSGRSTLWLGQLGQAYAMADQPGKARRVLAELERRAGTEYVSPYHLAYVHCGLGDAERALDYLEEAAAQGAGAIYGIKGSFLFKPLHSHPRFQALLRRMKLD